MTRVLILSPRHLTGYRDLAVADAAARDERPIAVTLTDADTYLVAASRWLEVSNKLIVYDDFQIDDLMHDVAAEAEMLGVDVEWRKLGRVPKPSIRERMRGLVS